MMTILEGIAKLVKELGGDRWFTIRVEVKHCYFTHYDPPKQEVTVEYSVWDATMNNHYHGLSVEDAVNRCLEANHKVASQDPVAALAGVEAVEVETLNLKPVAEVAVPAVVS
jgi:hypothetical protein